MPRSRQIWLEQNWVLLHQEIKPQLRLKVRLRLLNQLLCQRYQPRPKKEPSMSAWKRRNRFMVIAIGAGWITSTEQFLYQKTCSEEEIRMRSKIGFGIISKVIWTGIMERKIAAIRIRMIPMG